jgi:hypothetical protein
MNLWGHDNSWLQTDDRQNMEKWANASTAASLSMILLLLLPVYVMRNKTKLTHVDRMKYLNIGIFSQLGFGSLYVFSSYNLSRSLGEVEQKYFTNMPLESIKGYHTVLLAQQQQMQPQMNQQQQNMYPPQQQQPGYQQQQYGNQQYGNGIVDFLNLFSKCII